MMQIVVYINGREIAQATAQNVSSLADVSNYRCEADESPGPYSPGVSCAFTIMQHPRRQSCWELVEKMAQEICSRVPHSTRTLGSMNMKEPHTITEDELADYVEQKRQEWISFASSGGASLKRIDFCIRHIAPVYRVTFNGQNIYIGALKETAVREYNALP